MRFAILLLITLFLSDLIWKTESYEHCSCSLEQKEEAAEVEMRCSCQKDGGILESKFQQRKNCSVTTTKKKEKNGKMDEFKMRMTCPRPGCTLDESLINGDFDVSPGPEYLLNHDVTITCINGYELSEGVTQQSITCTENGFNMDDIRPCTKGCTLDESLINGDFVVSPGPEYPLNDDVIITCINGYELSEGVTQQSITCTENGFNMDDIRSCIKVCKLEQCLLNEKKAGSPVHNYLMNEVATIICNDGFFWSGAETEQNITCTVNGFNMDNIIPCIQPKPPCPNWEGIYSPMLGLNAIYVADKKNKTEVRRACVLHDGMPFIDSLAHQHPFKQIFKSIIGTQGPIWFHRGALVFDPVTISFSQVKISEDTLLPFFCNCNRLIFK